MCGCICAAPLPLAVPADLGQAQPVKPGIRPVSRSGTGRHPVGNGAFPARRVIRASTGRNRGQAVDRGS